MGMLINKGSREKSHGSDALLFLTKRTRPMNRDELAKELDVPPWDVDDWLLLGCPANKIRIQWEFNLEQVIIWLKNEKIRIKRMNPYSPMPGTLFDQRWFGKRCPICSVPKVPMPLSRKLKTKRFSCLTPTLKV